MNDKSQIQFKDDNQELFEFTVIEFANKGFIMKILALDLHNTDTPNIMTEYEKKFSSQGMRIYRVEAHQANS